MTRISCPRRCGSASADLEVYPRQLDGAGLEELSRLMRSDMVHIDIALGIGEATATVWGCDLSAEYVRINADYTT